MDARATVVVEFPVIVLPREYDFVRVLHEVELPPEKRITPARQPEVRPLFPNHYSEFGEEWQELSWTLNPLLTAGNMTAVYNDHLWIANGQGFGNTPRRNYFIPEDLDATTNIKVEALTCGGNVLRVLDEGKFKTNEGLEDCYFVEAMDWRIIPVFNLEKRPWLITTAVKLNNEGLPTRFPQGMQSNGFQPGVRHPLVADVVRYAVALPKWRAVKWTETFAPDPYEVYVS
jgi:hypothetical protein